MADKLTDNKRIVREYIEKIVNTGNVDLIPEYVSEDYTGGFKDKNYPMGVEGAMQHDRQLPLPGATG